MWKPRWMLVAGLLLSMGYLAANASLLWGQKKAEADTSDSTSASDQERELEIRYAQAYLKVMEATLAKYDELNRRLPNTIRATVIQDIRDATRKAQERVQLAQSDEVGDAQVYVASAEANLRVAEDALRIAQAANSRTPRAVGDGEIGQLKAQVELAKVRVDRARHLASESPLSNVRYELELLREDVQELQIRVALLRTRN